MERVFPTDRYGNPEGPAREEIIRCGDCKHWICGKCMIPDGNGDYARRETNPYGFCYWAVRRDE